MTALGYVVHREPERGFSLYRDRKGSTNEEGQPDEVAATDGLAQDDGGEEDGYQYAQLVDGDDHAGGAGLEGPAVAEPEGTRRSLQGEDGGRLAHKVLS